MRGDDEGQATVELALVLPVVVLLFLALLQVGVVVRDQIVVIHAAREAVREGAVDPRPEVPQRAALRASGMNGLTTQVKNDGGNLSVVLNYSSPTDFPLVGPLVPDVPLRARATMRIEVKEGHRT